jgi:hypothetical protein
MADEHRTNARPGGGVDDDRILAFVLGLDDDAELAAAAGDDAELRDRLETVRAEVAHVVAGVRAGVPVPGDDYTDLGDPRWAGLQEYWQPGQERQAGASRGSRRWLRVLAPVAAVALAVAVGASVIERQFDAGQPSVAERSGKSTDSSGTSAQSPGGSGSAGGFEESASSGGAVTGATPVAATTPVQDPEQFDAASAGPVVMAGGMPVPSDTIERLSALHEQLDGYAVIVLATAQQAVDGFQDFIVLRVLRGDSPPLLQLRIAGRLADVGRLHLVMLRPLSGAAAAPLAAEATSPVDGSAAETTTTAIVATAEAALFTSSVPVVYTFEGDMAVARALPADTDPYAVTLP